MIATAQAKDNSECVTCHTSEHQQWLQSDHAKSLALPDNQSVLGDFDNTKIKHNKLSATFFKKDNQFNVALNDGGEQSLWPIAYVVGHYPLQQYLAKTTNGRLQVLPFSYDTRAKSKGGQRWYFHGLDEALQTNSRLHWQQPLQNYNGMCADCHSTDVKRNYSQDNKTFDTQWQHISVACTACHTVSEQHQQPDVLTGHWIRQSEEKTAQWHGPARDNRFMQGCYACHSLRLPLTDGFSHDKAFLDQFSPVFLDSKMYHADGQIKEEVYVYGSFLQSKMHQAGVNCLDCHDKHSLKVKLPGNGVCLQCHSPAAFEAKRHHGHESNSEGAKCVNCHMPQTRFMGVDERADHSFKIPRPDLSIDYGVPNACQQCHQNQSAQWAAKQLKARFGQPKTLSDGQKAWLELNTARAPDASLIWRVARDKNVDDFTKASALAAIVGKGWVIPKDKLEPFTHSTEPLIRLASAKAAIALEAHQRHELLAPLLVDEHLAVRLAAVRSLVAVQRVRQDTTAVKNSLDELLAMYKNNAWRGEPLVEQAVISMQFGQSEQAIALLNNALQVDPMMPSLYINLAEIYRLEAKVNEQRSIYEQAIKQLPRNAEIAYNYGLFFIRSEKLAQALTQFERAVQIAPERADYHYAYVLALKGQGLFKQAKQQLDKSLKQHPDDKLLKVLHQRFKLITTQG